MKILLENWRSFLQEQETASNFCLLKDDQDATYYRYVLYNPINLIKNPQGFVKSPIQFSIEQGVVASFIAIGDLEPEYGECYGAREVGRSASNPFYKGQNFGFLLYKIAASEAYPRPITGDRTGTTQIAQNVYKKLPANAKDFDDIQHPTTPPPEDDCYMTKNATVNKAYFLDKGEVDRNLRLAKKFRKNHESFMKVIQGRIGYNPQSFISVLYKAADALFEKVYKP